MGWGEPLVARPADALATAVERFLAHPTTGNLERLDAALRAYRQRTRRAA